MTSPRSTKVLSIAATCRNAARLPPRQPYEVLGARVEIMQQWADFLDGLKKAAKDRVSAKT